MASRLRVDEITTTNETGNIVIPGSVGLDGSANTSHWALPKGTDAQRVSAPVGSIRYSTEPFNEGLEIYASDDGTGSPGWIKTGEVIGGNDGSSIERAATTTQELKDAGVTADGHYYMTFGGETVKVYVAFNRKVSRDWILVSRIPSGGYSVSDSGGGSYFSLDRPATGSGNSVSVWPTNTQKDGPTLSTSGTLNLRANKLPESFFSYIMTEIDYSGTEYWNAFPSGGRNLEASGTSATFFTETPIGRSNTYDTTIKWHAELGSLSGWRSSHYACGSSVSAPNVQYSGFGVCRTGASDSGGNNSGSINALSLWTNTAYINAYPHSGGTEYGSEWRMWISQ